MTEWNDKTRVYVVVTYENRRTQSFSCETTQAAVRCWLREMTANQNTSNPAMAVVWILSLNDTGEGVLLGEFRRPSTDPGVVAWAQVVDAAKVSSENAEAEPREKDTETK